MSKATLDLDPDLVARLEAFAASTGRSPPRLIADLLDAATALVGAAPLTPPRAASAGEAFEWTSRPMGARVDLTDKEALHRILDASLIDAVTGRDEEG